MSDLDKELEEIPINPSKILSDPETPLYKLTERPLDTRKRLTLSEKLVILADKGVAGSPTIAKKYGIAESTVRLIWKDERLAKRVKAVNIIKENLEHDMLLTMDAAQKRVLKTMDKASVSQATMAYGVFFDKRRLLLNESTQNVSHNVWLDLVNSVPVDDKFDKC
jgi:hypothetical protein